MKNQNKSFLKLKIVDDTFQLFNPDEGELKKIVKTIIPIPKKEVAAMLECSWNRITEDLIIDTWNKSIFKKISINTSIEEIDIIM